MSNNRKHSVGRNSRAILLGLALALLTPMGCNYAGNISGLHWFLGMHDNHAVEGQEEDYTTWNNTYAGEYDRGMDSMDVFGGPGSSIRVPPEGTVPREHEPYPYEAGDFAGAAAGLSNPLPRTQKILERGEKMYNIYCAVCHGNTGAGDGPVTPRLANVPALTS
ncbi:MAG: hypothetical protein KDK27_17885, partial [Leptospiraceae bacterium]|nr:hypothetical protein [Leptospiraceae bacterium]